MVTYRVMEIDDYQQVMTLWSVTEHMSLRDADSKENIGAYLARNPGLSFVALADDKVVGALLVGTDGRRGYVQHLAVASTLRGQGIGKQLISLCVDALAEMGIMKTHLFVLKDNLPAQKFYAKLDWYPRNEVTMMTFNHSDNLNV
ncbi:GNAT family N-acetyltransferase [Vibrio porteresiae]|uniref:GNAT family N-acetyltransferase n=1 Tax=Vibrio porteresiae DSM 19223 TaxID=1123496 RepID=A0ABZ0QH39_9VIBR|nr:GNAT family N-acetyltransferase [Vibrio porteresiae]WPC75824.1 GNAT family N-acetyltransferase [Vibrio porteresiae DSM 19223]